LLGHNPRDLPVANTPMPSTAFSGPAGPPPTPPPALSPIAACTRTLHIYGIHGIALAAYDETSSETADRVAGELFHDAYGFAHIPFEAGDVVIDIGAHVGLVSIYLAKRWPFLRIEAFEPHPTNHRNCIDNLDLNGVSNVHVSQLAVTADRRPLVLQSLRCNTGGATAVFDMPGADRSPAMDSVTLADILDMTLTPGQRCRLLKIDSEGIEYEILPSPALARVDFLAAEFHEDARDGGNQERGGRSRAQALGAQCARYVRPDRLRVICCPKHD
jgi:FkbM family methyltransferase